MQVLQEAALLVELHGSVIPRRVIHGCAIDRSGSNLACAIAHQQLLGQRLCSSSLESALQMTGSILGKSLCGCCLGLPLQSRVGDRARVFCACGSTDDVRGALHGSVLEERPVRHGCRGVRAFAWNSSHAQTNRKRLGAPPAAATTKPSTGRVRRRTAERERGVGLGFRSWAPSRAAGRQEASSEISLEKKKCVPCETGKLQPMSEENARSLLPEVSGWELKEIDGVLQLQRSWKAKSFMKGLEIMKRVADVAEAEGHHPDLHLVNWNQLSINISTHAVGGLTENDFIVAAKIGALDLADLVRKPKAVAKSTLKPSPS